MTDDETVCRNLTFLREFRRLSVNRLADAAGIDRGYLSRVLRGKSSPTVRTLGKLAEALEVKTLDLFRPDLPDLLAPLRKRRLVQGQLWDPPRKDKVDNS